MKSDSEQHPGFLIYDITRLFRQVFGARLQDLELSESRWRVLGTLSRFPGISQTQLAWQLAIGRAPLGELVDKLQGEGLVERRPNPNDGRVKQLFATDKAEPLIGEILQRFQELKGDFFRGISPGQLADLEDMLQQLYQNLVRLEPNAPPELLPAEISFMHLATCISRLISRHFDEQLKALGFTRSQWLVLAGIRESEGVQQNVLAQTLSMRKAPLGVLIDNLEANRWVERRPHPQDRRAKQLFLSPACKRQLKSLRTSFDELHSTTLVGISAANRETLAEGLALVRTNLQILAAQHSAAAHATV